jgi:hypothetical protein
LTIIPLSLTDEKRLQGEMQQSMMVADDEDVDDDDNDLWV